MHNIDDIYYSIIDYFVRRCNVRFCGWTIHVRNVDVPIGGMHVYQHTGTKSLHLRCHQPWNAIRNLRLNGNNIRYKLITIIHKYHAYSTERSERTMKNAFSITIFLKNHANRRIQ